MKKIIIISIMILLIPISIKAIETSATSAILVDTDSGRILYSKDIHNQRSIASISKIMTAIVAIESNKLEETVEIGEEITDAYGSGIYIKQNEHMRLEDLVYGLMLRSGNDAALAIAKYVGGSVENFVEMMNQKAQQLGMKNTIFNNPSGLDEEKGNLSTAYDMSLLISYAIKNEEFKKITGTKKHKVETDMNIYSWTNKNKLLFSYKYTTGGKTGFTQIARRTLVTTATKDNLNLAVVTLNDGNDFEDHKNLFEYGFTNYTNYQLLKKGVISIPDENQETELYIENDYNYALLEQETKNILIKYKLEEKPTDNNAGCIEIYLGDKIIHQEPIYSRKKEQQTKTLIQKIKEWFKNL